MLRPTRDYSLKVVEFRKKAELPSVFSFMFCRLKRLFLEGILHTEDIFALTNTRIKLVKISYMLQEQINYEELWVIRPSTNPAKHGYRLLVRSDETQSFPYMAL